MVVAFGLAMPSAEAKGLMIINTGDDVKEVSDIKDEIRAEVEADTAPGVKIGFMYSRFGVFWLDIWRWSGKFVLYQGTTVWEAPEEALKEIAKDGL